MKQLTKISRSPNDTEQIAFELGSKLKSPVLIGLNGPLGAGKTVFAKGIANALGVKELVTSPTFLGISEYYSGKIPFIHMDFYQKVTEAGKIEYFLKKPSVVLIEWANNFQEVIGRSLNMDISIAIDFDIKNIENEQNREIIIRYTKFSL